MSSYFSVEIKCFESYVNLYHVLAVVFGLSSYFSLEVNCFFKAMQIYIMLEF